LISCSFDKGFHSPDNQKELAVLLDKVILPRKGKLSAINKEIENSEEFKEARRKHSAIESSINGVLPASVHDIANGLWVVLGHSNNEGGMAHGKALCNTRH
jgi:hypothetical protein